MYIKYINNISTSQKSHRWLTSVKRKWIPTECDATGMHHYTWPSTPPHGGWAGWGREAQREQEGGKERRAKTPKQRGERRPVTKQLLCQKSQEKTPKHTQQHACTQSKQGGGWWELECQSNVTEDDRSILTALTARRPSTAADPTARPRRRPSQGENVLHVDSCCFSVLAPSPTPTSTSSSLTLSGHLHCRNGPWTKRRCCVFYHFSDKVEAVLFVFLKEGSSFARVGQ